MLATTLFLVINQSRTLFPIAIERSGEVLVIKAPNESSVNFGAGTNPVVSPDGRRVASTQLSSQGEVSVTVHQISDKSKLADLKSLPKGTVRGLAWSPDSLSLAFEHDFPEEGRTLYVWKVRETRANGLFNVTDHEEPMSPAFSGNNSKVAILWKGVVRELDISTGSINSWTSVNLTEGLPTGSKVLELATVPATQNDYFYTVQFSDEKVKPALFLYRSGTKSVSRISPVGLGVSKPRLCPDTRAVVFEGESEGEHWLMSLPIQGGTPTKLAQL